MIVVTESDGFALVMLGVILLSFGILLMLGFCMFRNASKRDGDVDDLIEEVSEAEKPRVNGKIAAGESKQDAWEKDGDWWKE